MALLGPMCVVPILFFVDLAFLAAHVNAACLANEFECIGGQCIPDAKRNDSIFDCPRRDDEGEAYVCDPMAELVKPQNQVIQRFKCVDGLTCILEYQFNDGSQHCADLSDEFKYIDSPCQDEVVQIDENSNIIMVPDKYNCDYWMSNSECVSNVCSCKSGTFVNSDRLGCTVRVLGDSCSTYLDCYDAVTYSECSTVNDCACQLGYKAIGMDICQLREIYDKCGTDDDCSTAVSNSHCPGGDCRCVSGYKVGNGNTTCTLRQISDACSIDTDCSDAVTNSECTNSPKECVCTYNYIPETDFTSCRYRQLGDTCIASDHCLIGITNSTCADNVCQCVPGYIGSYGNNCALREIGDACDLDSDCSTAIVDAECKNNECACPAGYMLSTDSKSCIPRDIGSVCVTDEDCLAVIPNTECVGTPQACSCKTGYYGSNGACKGRDLGVDPCSGNDDCASIAGSVCSTPSSNSVCVCEADLVEVAGECKQVPKGECAEEQHCSYLGVNSTCVGGYCGCNGGNVVSSDGNSCVPRPDPPKIGDPCTSDTQCNISNAACLRGKCNCTDGYTLEGIACVAGSPIIEPVQESTFPWWIIGVILGIVLLIVIIAVIIGAILKKKKKKKIEEPLRPPTQSYKLKFPNWFNNSVSPVAMYEEEDTRPPPDVFLGPVAGKGMYRLKFPPWFTNAPRVQSIYDGDDTRPPPDDGIGPVFPDGTPNRHYFANADMSLYKSPEIAVMYMDNKTLEPYNGTAESRHRDWSVVPKTPALYDHPDTMEPYDEDLFDMPNEDCKRSVYSELDAGDDDDRITSRADVLIEPMSRPTTSDAGIGHIGYSRGDDMPYKSDTRGESIAYMEFNNDDDTCDGVDSGNHGTAFVNPGFDGTESGNLNTVKVKGQTNSKEDGLSRDELQDSLTHVDS